jgi:hypothetical protein
MTDKILRRVALQRMVGLSTFGPLWGRGLRKAAWHRASCGRMLHDRSQLLAGAGLARNEDELGKVLAQRIVAEVEDDRAPTLEHDSSTNNWIARYRNLRESS